MIDVTTYKDPMGVSLGFFGLGGGCGVRITSCGITTGILPILERHCVVDVNDRHSDGRGLWRRHELRSEGSISQILVGVSNWSNRDVVGVW